MKQLLISHLAVYSLLSLIAGLFIGYAIGDMETGLIDAGVLGIVLACWSILRQIYVRTVS